MLLSFFQTADQLASFLRIARICVDVRFRIFIAVCRVRVRRKLRQRTCKHAVFVIAARIVPVHDNKPVLRQNGAGKKFLFCFRDLRVAALVVYVYSGHCNGR